MTKVLKDLGSPLFSTYLLAGYPAMPRPVPETTPTRYLSGMISLCLTSPWTDDSPGQNIGPDCLYCFEGEQDPLPTWGEGGDGYRNTLHIYGNYGIHNYAKILKNFGFDHNYKIVYGADHYRAILDIVYADIYNNNIERAKNIGFFTNWITLESIVEINACLLILDKISLMESFLPSEKVELLHLWMHNEKKIIEGGRLY